MFNAKMERRLSDVLAASGCIGLDRDSWIKLPHQVADALRLAIANGVWTPGAKLPSTRDIASELGVSRRVALDALRILSKEGRVSLREKSTAVVNVEESAHKNHKVLLLRQGSASFADAEERIRMRLNDAGYMVSTASLPRVGAHGRYDIARLRADLRRPYELVVCPHTKPYVLGVLKASGQPFARVFCDAVKSPNFVGAVPLRTDGAEGAFVRHCVRRSVKSVVIVGKWRGDGARVLSGLLAAGVAAETWIVPAKVCVYRREAVERAAFHAFSRRLADGRAWLPEVLYFTDDYLCYGAMTAMLTHGVRVPEDVRVATLAIRSGLRTFKTSLSRIEYDMLAMSEVISDSLLEYLRAGVFPPDVSVGPAWRVGGSFP